MATITELQKAAEQNASAPSPAQNAETAAGVSAPATSAGGNVTDGAYTTARTDAINDIYDAQKAQRVQELESAYNQSQSSYQATADKIPAQYQQKANDLAVQYERNRRNFNQQAAGSGINTGTASQAALAQNSEYQRDYGNIRTAQADAQSAVDLQMSQLKSKYQSDIKSALATNDYERAAALLDEYNNGYERNLKNAQILAEFGDFSGYSSLYGQEQASGMKDIWKVQNPDLAFNTGNMTAEEYRLITGVYPVGYNTAIGSGASYEQANTGALDYMRDVFPVGRTSGYSAPGGGGRGFSDPWDYGGAGWNPTNGGLSPENIYNEALSAGATPWAAESATYNITGSHYKG